MSVKLAYFLFEGWIAISTGEVIVQHVSIYVRERKCIKWIEI